MNKTSATPKDAADKLVKNSHICLGVSDELMKKPNTLPHEVAGGMCDGPLTSFHFLRETAQVQSWQRSLIFGGSGSLGVRE